MVKPWSRLPRETVKTPFLEIHIHIYTEQSSRQPDLIRELGLTSKFVLLLEEVWTSFLLEQSSNLSCSMKLFNSCLISDTDSGFECSHSPESQQYPGLHQQKRS